MPDENLRPGCIVNQRFRVKSKIGAGGFSVVYNASCVYTNSKKYAIKAEEMEAANPQLRHEYKVYREMKDTLGFSPAYYFGESNNNKILVLERLGDSLERKLERCGGKVHISLP